ncbi:MAG: radical SAM protein, partial [Mycobacterium sp.]|nr:radical SAM protein [Mycobacterium sp.]
DVLANVDQRLARENGRLDVLMLSGGEPTLHPRLGELLAELVARPITRILVNTNGIRIAADDALLDLLTEHRERVEVYL